MRVVVLVPRRAGEPHRDRVWAWARGWWARNFSDWEVFEGHHDDGPFNRAAAINAAAQAAGDFEVAIVADADSIVDPETLERASRRAAHAWRVVIAFERFAHLTRAMTDRIMAGYTGSWEPGVDWSMTGTCSSMLAVPRVLWDAAGGFDDRFVGWGWEDVAFAHAALTFGGDLDRMPGTLWHLWHPPAGKAGPHGHEDSNEALALRYRDASGDRLAMAALRRERQGVSA